MRQATARRAFLRGTEAARHRLTDALLLTAGLRASVRLTRTFLLVWRESQKKNTDDTASGHRFKPWSSVCKPALRAAETSTRFGVCQGIQCPGLGCGRRPRGVLRGALVSGLSGRAATGKVFHEKPLLLRRGGFRCVGRPLLGRFGRGKLFHWPILQHFTHVPDPDGKRHDSA